MCPGFVFFLLFVHLLFFCPVLSPRFTAVSAKRFGILFLDSAFATGTLLCSFVGFAGWLAFCCSRRFLKQFLKVRAAVRIRRNFEVEDRSLCDPPRDAKEILRQNKLGQVNKVEMLHDFFSAFHRTLYEGPTVDELYSGFGEIDDAKLFQRTT